MRVYARRRGAGVSMGPIGWLLTLVIVIPLFVCFWTAVAILALGAWLVGGLIYGGGRLVAKRTDGRRGERWIRAGATVIALPGGVARGWRRA